MKKEVVDVLVQTAEDHQMDITVYRDYSGRGMYGSRTDGVVVESLVDLAALATLAGFQLGEAGRPGMIEEVFEALREARVDNLGKQWIVY